MRLCSAVPRRFDPKTGMMVMMMMMMGNLEEAGDLLYKPPSPFSSAHRTAIIPNQLLRPVWLGDTLQGDI